MHATPTTGGRHALWWVVGVGLVFVAVFAMALQVARQREEERWIKVMMALKAPPEFGFDPDIGHCSFGQPISLPAAWQWILLNPGSRKWITRGGTLLRAWNQYDWDGRAFTLVVRQERSLLGSSLEARMSGGTAYQIETARAILAAADVELIIEP